MYHRRWWYCLPWVCIYGLDIICLYAGGIMAFYQLDGELKVVGLLPIFYGKLCETKGILEAFSIGELMKEIKGTIHRFILMWNGNSMNGTHEHLLGGAIKSYINSNF